MCFRMKNIQNLKMRIDVKKKSGLRKKHRTPSISLDLIHPKKAYMFINVEEKPKHDFLI